MADFLAKLDLVWKAFWDAPFSDASYSTYLNSLLEIASRYPESDHIVARYIAHTMFLESVEADATKEAIAQYAGELENPATPTSARQANWTRIRELLDEL